MVVFPFARTNDDLINCLDESRWKSEGKAKAKLAGSYRLSSFVFNQRFALNFYDKCLLIGFTSLSSVQHMKKTSPIITTYNPADVEITIKNFCALSLIQMVFPCFHEPHCESIIYEFSTIVWLREALSLRNTHITAQHFGLSDSASLFFQHKLHFDGKTFRFPTAGLN